MPAVEGAFQRLPIEGFPDQDDRFARTAVGFDVFDSGANVGVVDGTGKPRESPGDSGPQQRVGSPGTELEFAL